MEVTERVEIDGRTLELEIGKLAKQADGAPSSRFGDTVVLATAVLREGDREERRLLPAHRRLPRVHLRRGPDPRRLVQARGPADREGDPHLPPDRPPAAAALPRGLHHETQIVAFVLSADGENDPDILAINGASRR